MVSNFKLTILLLALAFILRFFNLGQNPPSLNWDETAHGYNAYSILKTGRDEYGLKLPLYFRSFDDYKPPLYTYLVVPSVAVFGLNDYAVRFPSALLGTFAVLFTYFMVSELFKSKKIALITAFLLAISPWHLQFSRVAFETNSAIFWSVVATWAFLRAMRSQGSKISIWICLSSIAFSANLYMYHNSRVFVPLFALLLLILYYKKLIHIKKYLFLPAVIALMAVITLIPIAISDAGQVRFKGTAVFGDVSPLYKASALILDDEKSGGLIPGQILHNRRFVYVPIIVENYFSHFRPSFLFFEADMERHHAPLMGLLYIWEIPFLLAGVYFLIKNSFDVKTKAIIFWWFLIAPVASSVTWGVPHSLRSEIYLPMYQIFTALGIYFLMQAGRGRTIVYILSIIIISNFFIYLHQYHHHMPLEFSEAWKYGRKQAALYSEAMKDNYDRIIVSTKLEQPHEFWLYYLKYDPNRYLAEGGTISGSFREERNRFDKYLFKSIDYQIQKKEAKTLFVGRPEEFPSDANVLKKFNYLNGQAAIYVGE